MPAPALVHAPVRSRTMADVKRTAAARKLLPSRDVLRERYPDRYREETNPRTGKREWVVDVPLRDLEGKRTKGSHDLQDMLTPYIRHGGRLPLPEPQGDRMRDQAGREQYVHPALVESTRKRTGWREAPSRRASIMERGPGGMLFRLTRSGWEPTGRWCMGTPWTQSERPMEGRRDGTIRDDSFQVDPSGRMWRGLGRDGWACIDAPRLVRWKR